MSVKSPEAVDAQIEALKQEKILMEMSKAFREAKADGSLTKKMKHDLRAARQKFREEHRQPAPGASPAAIGTEGVTS
jgi:hypothetical protein